MSLFLHFFSLVMCASINGSVSQIDLKEGESVEIYCNVSFEQNESLEFLKFKYNGNVIAQDPGNGFSIAPFGTNLYGNRISCNVSGFNLKLKITDLRANDSLTIQIELLYIKPENIYLPLSTEVAINVNGLYFFLFL